MNKSHIWFDLGYTLVYLDREKKLQQILKEEGYEFNKKEISRAFHLADKHFMKEFPGILGGNPENFLPWYMSVLTHFLGLRINTVNIAKKFYEKQYNLKPEEQWIAYPGIHEKLEKLKDSSLTLGIISNWNHTARRVIKHNNFTKYFDNIIISSEVDYEKPDPRIFNIAFEKAGVEPEQCIYIGDNYYDDCIGSIRVGMDCLIINPYDKLGMEEVKDCDIITDISEIFEYIPEDNKN